MLERNGYKKLHYLDCVTLVVDVNSSELMFRSNEAILVGQFVRDVLSGSISAVQKSGGSVVSSLVMGL